MTAQVPPGAEQLAELVENFLSLSDEQQKSQRDELRFLLQRRIEGIHYAETRRNGIATLATGVFAAGVALIATTANVTQISSSIGSGLMILSLGFLVSGILTWIVFVRQINPAYPFITATANKKWFYHGALPAKGVLAAYKSLRGTFTSKKAEEDRERDFNKHVPEFYKVTGEWLLDPRASLEADIKQLHSLHSNECVKNAQLTLIRTVFVTSIGISLLLSVCAFTVSSFTKRQVPIELERTPIVRNSTKSGEKIRKYILRGEASDINTLKIETSSGKTVAFTLDGFLTESDELTVWIPENDALQNKTLRVRLQ